MIDAKSELELALGVFWMIFLAELGDRTQVATLLMAADQPSHRLAVFAGAATALVLATAIGVLAAGWVSHYLPARTLHIAVALVFIVYGLWILAKTLPA
ncbi:MAG: TMEM165/GDT1 family protein [Nevskiaceae bacterium]